jgi:hypothetical protein
MLKKIISYIFIYIFVIGCEDSVVGSNHPTHTCSIEVDAPYLEMDENGYYHLYFIDGDIQTFSTMRAQIGLEDELVNWISNKEINIPYYGQPNWVNLINSSSYSDEDGISYGILGVWQPFIGDTIKIYAGYRYCGVECMDSLEVIVE